MGSRCLLSGLSRRALRYSDLPLSNTLPASKRLSSGKAAPKDTDEYTEILQFSQWQPRARYIPILPKSYQTSIIVRQYESRIAANERKL